MVDDRSIRASDEDRQRVVDTLQEQTSEGRLTFDEFEERMGAAYAAKTWDELHGLTRDLPIEVAFTKANEHQPAPTSAAPPSRQHRPRHWDLLASRVMWLVPMLAVIAAVATLAATNGHHGFPFWGFALFWVFCGRGFRSRLHGRGHRHNVRGPHAYREHVHHT